MNLKLLFFIVLITISSIAQNKNKTIGFKENKGQIVDQKGKPNNAVKYLLNSGGLNVQLRKNGFSYDVYEAKKHPINHSHDEKKKPLPFPSKDNENLPDYTLEYQYHRIDIDFLNSNPKVELITEEKSLDYDNYYNIPNKPEGILMVHQYKQITYKNIYPNIDVVFSIPKDTLKTVEYNFVVHPKGKISDIQLKFSGAQTELVDNKIRMSVRFGEMEETLPASWTEDGELKKEIAVGYKKVKKNVYGFESSENISDKTVIIDPVPIRLWGTFYVGTGAYDFSNSITSDNTGNVYFTGQTFSADNIATAGAFQTFQSIASSAFIAKLNPNGQRLWGTFVLNAVEGSSGNTQITNAVVNSTNELYIVGYVFNIDSSNTILTTINSFKQSESGFNYEGLVMKFDTNGQRIWGTFYGGDGDDRIRTISLDSNENLIIAGETNSKTGIATTNAYQKNILDDFYGCGFIAKFTAIGARTYGTYFSGKINYSAVDNNNNLIFAGQYKETDATTPNITTAGAYQTQIHNVDGFIVKFNPTGEQRLWCTYYGGDASFTISVSDYLDQIKGLGIDQANNIYIVGLTNSTNLIATAGAFKSTQIPGSVDSFIAKFNSLGQIQWGTYFGSDTSGQNDDKCSSGFITSNGDIYISGNTRSDKDISTLNSYQTITNGSDEGFIAKFNTNGGREWGTYYGSSYQDFPQDIFQKNSKLYIIGNTTYSTSSIQNPFGTLGTHQPVGYGLFIAKFQDCLSAPEINSNSPICSGNIIELKAAGGTNYSWAGPNSFASTDQNPSIPNATALNSGQYSCNITGTGGCDGVATINVIVGDTVAPIPNLATLRTITGDCHTALTTIPTATDACAGVITATTASALSYNLPGTYTVVWDYDDGNGNISHQNQTVNISTQPLPTVTSPQTFCIQQNATINDIVITGQNIKWYDALTAGILLSNTTPLQNGITYYASQTINGCESERIPVTVNIQNTLTPTGNANQSFCTSQNPTLSTIVLVGSTIKWYDNSTLGNLLIDNTHLVDGKTYFATQTENNCESINRLAVTVSLISSLPANDYAFSICDDLNDAKETVKLEDYNSYLISNTANYSFSYYKSLPDAENEVASNKITTASSFKLALGENNIYVRINSNTTCYAIAVLKITLFSKPIIPIQDVMPICENKSILIDAGSGADSYLWSNGKTDQTISIDNPRDLSVTVTKNYGTLSCTSDKTFTVKTSNIAKITAIETTDWTDNDNTITVFVSGSRDFEYSIDGSNYQDSNTFSSILSGECVVYVRDKNGCGTATEEVYLLMYPKFFTPNGDGFNDTWKIKSSNIEDGLTIKIFDRFGKLLKELDSNSNGWDGNYIGQTLPATDYWFAVTRANGKVYKGHFSLKR